jgi:hypothetical protein
VPLTPGARTANSRGVITSRLLIGLFAVVATVACSAQPSLSEYNSNGSKKKGDKSSSSSGILGEDGEDGEDGTTNPAVCAPNPANVEVPGNGCDDDGDGTVDNAPTCDGSAAGSAQDPKDFARTLGLCKFADASKPDDWGVVSVRYTNGFGAAGAPAAAQYSSLGKFGDVLKPREGSRLGVLSTGVAQEYNGGAGTTFKRGIIAERAGVGTLPPGFPKATGSCDVADDVHDVAGVHIEIKVPRNATGFSFDFNFMSGEWPEFVCSRFNDGFIAFLQSEKTKDNISFDKQGGSVSVNNGFFDRCTPNTQTGCAGSQTKVAACPGGADELRGTGFFAMDDYCGGKQSVGGGATGWLTSKAPVRGGEIIKLDFLIWNTGDSDLDSSVLLDHFTWLADGVPVSTGTDRSPPVVVK